MGFIDSIGGKIASLVGNIDEGIFYNSLLLRMVDQKIKGFFEPIGADRLGWMIDNNVSLESCLPPEQIVQLKEGTKQYAEFSEKISDRQIIEFLPQWSLDVIGSRGHQGNMWMKTQIKTLRSYFGG